MAEYNPNDYTVDQVNAHLAENPDQVAAVLAAEADTENGGQARKGILEGPHAAQEDPPAPEGGQGATDAPTTAYAVATAAQDTGYLGEVNQPDGDDPNAPRTADAAAPADTDGDGYDGTVTTAADDRPATVVDAGNAQDLDQHPDGYVGTLPGDGDREDLTLAGVIARGV